LIDEPTLDAAPTQEIATLTTNSNFTFGIISGHDFVFEDPVDKMLEMGIRYFLHNGAWKNKMPFLFCKLN
jgi:hypothetical protein